MSSSVKPSLSLLMALTAELMTFLTSRLVIFKNFSIKECGESPERVKSRVGVVAVDGCYPEVEWT